MKYPDIEFEALVLAIYPKAEIVDNVVNYITIMKITNKNGDCQNHHFPHPPTEGWNILGPS